MRLLLFTGIICTIMFMFGVSNSVNSDNWEQNELFIKNELANIKTAVNTNGVDNAKAHDAINVQLLEITKLLENKVSELGKEQTRQQLIINDMTTKYKIYTGLIAFGIAVLTSSGYQIVVAKKNGNGKKVNGNGV